MAARLTRLVGIVLAAAAASCASTPAHFYTLDSTASRTGAPLPHGGILVGPVSVPAAVDQPQFVVQVSPNRVDVDEANRWVAPLNDVIARAVAGDLAAQLDMPDVAIAPLANFSPAYRVTIDIQRFQSIKGQGVIVDAVWTVHQLKGGRTRSGRTIAREPVREDSFDALAAGHSRALAKVSEDIAAAIRAEAGEVSSSGGRRPAALGASATHGRESSGRPA